MGGHLDWETGRFLMKFRNLGPEERASVAWLMRNLDVLGKLLPSEHLSLDVLNSLADQAHTRKDTNLECLTMYALLEKRAHLEEQSLTLGDSPLC